MLRARAWRGPWTGSNGCSGTATKHRALETIGSFEDDVSALEVDYPNLGKFARAAYEFAVYITSNTGSLINFDERYRAGERISSCLA
jgi:hypothetical protein